MNKRIKDIVNEFKIEQIKTGISEEKLKQKIAEVKTVNPEIIFEGEKLIIKLEKEIDELKAKIIERDKIIRFSRKR